MCEPGTTLFIMVSKTFTTQETITNAITVHKWFPASGRKVLRRAEHKHGGHDRVRHLVRKHVPVLGLGRRALLALVRDRLSIALVVGYDTFEVLLRGAHRMDKHFKTVPLEQNLPVLLALVGLCYNNFYGAQTQLLLPYDHLFADFQQGGMESKGMFVTNGGQCVDYQTGPIIWGTVSTSR